MSVVSKSEPYQTTDLFLRSITFQFSGYFSLKNYNNKDMAAPDDFSFGWQDEFLSELMRRPKYVRAHHMFSRIL